MLLLLGGDFGALATTPSLIPVLVSNLSAFLDAHGYVGVDLDWEYPTDTQASTFYALVSALRGAMPAGTYTLSADVPPWGGAGYDLPASAALLDYVNVMMYDCAGPWTDSAQLNSPIFKDPANPEAYNCKPGGSAEQTIDLFENQLGLAPAQLNLGTPFYGYHCHHSVSALWEMCPGSSCAGTTPSVAYGTYVKPRIGKAGWTVNRDPVAQVPYLVRTDGTDGFITYDDAESTSTRVHYAVWQRGLGGTFLWSLDADYDGESQDLLDAMAEASRRR